MTAVRFIVLILIVLAILYFILYILVPDIFATKKQTPDTPLDELEKESEALAEKKSEIRSATDQKHKQIEKINKNLKK